MRRVGWVILASCASPDAHDSTASATNVCPPAVVEGIDVAAGQGDIAWNDVVRTRAFVFVKATQGTYNVQRTFADHYAGAKQAGIVRGAYHFFDPTQDGADQARFFLAALDTAGGLRAGDLPPMLDLECPSHAREDLAAKTCLYAGASGWAPPALIRARAQAWLDTIEHATGRKPILYSYVSWFTNAAFIQPAAPKKLAAYPLFIASLATCPAVPEPWTVPTFWQYSFTGAVDGIGPEVDLDRFLGTTSDLRAFTLQSPDAGVPDASVPETGVPDASAPEDASADRDVPITEATTSTTPLEPTAPASEGCVMHASANAVFAPWWLALLVLARRRSPE